MNKTEAAFPHIHSPVKTASLYWRLNIALLIPITFGVLRHGVDSIWIIPAAVLGALSADQLMSIIFVDNESSSNIVTGKTLFIALLVAGLSSPSAPFAMPIIAAAFAVIFSHVFCSGAHWFNPALLGLAFVFFMFPAPEYIVLSDSTNDIQMFSVLFHHLIQPFALNAENVLERAAAEELHTASLIANLPGPVLLASLIIYSEDIVPLVLPLFFLLSFIVSVVLIGSLGYVSTPFTALVSGDLLFLLVFALAYPGACPKHYSSMMIFGIFAGGLSAIFLHTELVRMGTITAILIAEIFVPFWDWIKHT